MEKAACHFGDFLAEVHPDYREFVVNTHEPLLRDGYKVKIESKASGFFVSYAHPKTKRSLLNFLFREKGLFVRIYADHLGQYADFLHSLPETMEKEISKASECKRLVNPEDCSPRCVRGYDFIIRGIRYQKCRYGCFQFAVTSENLPVLAAFLKKERRERQAV